jgi:hypothetical protein
LLLDSLDATLAILQARSSAVIPTTFVMKMGNAFSVYSLPILAVWQVTTVAVVVRTWFVNLVPATEPTLAKTSVVSHSVVMVAMLAFLSTVK